MSARFLNQARQHHVQLCGQWARGSDSPNIWWLLMVQDPCVPVCSLTQSCPALCNPMDYSLPGSSVHGILQARYWSGLPCPPPGDLPEPGMEPASLVSPVLTGGFFTGKPSEKAMLYLFGLKQEKVLPECVLMCRFSL